MCIHACLVVNTFTNTHKHTHTHVSARRDVSPLYDFATMRAFPIFRYDDPVKEFPFSSASKWSGIVVPNIPMEAFQAATPPVPQGLRLLAKGAPERCLSLCTSVWWTDSDSVPPTVVPLTQAIREAITAAQTEMAKAGLRTLALMYRCATVCPWLPRAA